MMLVTWLGETTRRALIGVLREVVAREELTAAWAGHQVTLHRRHLCRTRYYMAVGGRPFR